MRNRLVATGRTMKHRRGLALMAALVTLVVVASLSMMVSRSVVSRFRQQRLEEWKLQAQWLAASGLERAAAQQALDPEYRGETWIIDATELGQRGRGEVHIEIADDKQIQVRARFPAEHETAMSARMQTESSE